MKTTKKFISFIMAVVILFSGIETFPVTALDNQSTVTTENDDLTVSGTNSTGNLIANALSDIQAEQEENNGYNVFSATVEENVVVLEVETLEDCTVAVGIYDEAGTKLITSGYTPITTEDKTAIVVLETEEMPQYFYLRAFLVDSNTFRPISTSYECPNYTQEMQEFLAKTTEDFEADRVVNFDDSIDNNFAVYDDATIVIPEDSTGNDVASVDDETGVYVIEDADESITSLVAGDIFAYEYEDGNILIVKVASITIEGTTATITGEETTLEEVFEYVKIDTTASTEDATVDTSTLDEGVSYEGIIEVEDDSTSTYAVDVEGKKNFAFSFGIDKNIVGTENNNINVSGKLEYGLELSFKAYISFSYKYLEFKVENSIGFEVTVGGKISDSLPLPKLAITPCAGVIVEFKPEFLIEFTAEFSLSGKLTDTFGFSWSSDEGAKNLTSAPEFETEVKVEGGFFLGIKLSPTLVIINKTIGKVELEGRFGGEVKAEKMLHEDESSSSHHVCDECIDGDITGVFDITFKLNLLGGFIESEYSIVDVSLKISDFYYSYDYNEFEFTTCPHIYYKVNLTITDTYGKSVSGATVNLPLYIKSQDTLINEHTTDINGKVEGYLANGAYEAVAEKEGYTSTSEKITVKNNPKILKIKIQKAENLDSNIQTKALAMPKNSGWGNYSLGMVIDENGDLYRWGTTYIDWEMAWPPEIVYEENTTPTYLMSNVASVYSSETHNALITNNGDLYMWGECDDYQLGNGVDRGYVHEPMKIMENVVTVSLGIDGSAAITEDGGLYVWGNNVFDQLGANGESFVETPTKIMDNVASVALGDSFGMAATEDGTLYIWGNNGSYGDFQLGAYIGDYIEEVPVPRKAQEKSAYKGVTSVFARGTMSAFITVDGELYTRGGINDDKTQKGMGTNTEGIKILDNVVSVSISSGGYHSAAITEDGSLYIWGYNNYGNLGDGTTTKKSIPTKIMSDVAEVSLGEYCSGVVTTNGDLYTFGENVENKLGDGTTIDSLVPKKIMNNVRVMNGKAAMTYNVNSFYTDTVTDAISPTEKTMEYTGLLANEIYNFYVMKDRESELPFGADNLLYMTQAVSDAEGNLSITYTPTAECDTADIFVKGMTRKNLENSIHSIHSIVYDRTNHYIDAHLILDGEILEKNYHYEVLGDEIVRNIGKYSITINGIGDYTGTLTTTYEVYCGHDYNTGKCIMCGHNKGDADANGEINIDDYNLMASASALTTVIEDDVARCDMNGDGVVDGFDAIILDLRNNDMLRSTVTGDANGDGMVDDNDYNFLESVINGETASTDNITRLCDLNNDHAITTDDLTMLESYLNGNLDWT